MEDRYSFLEWASESGMDATEMLPADLAAIRSRVFTWYEHNQRSIPWRQTTDPYHITVAEVMSQQTQIARVIQPYERFITKWPTVEALAATALAEVVSFWSDHSLGYNTRARYLHELATIVVDEYQGEFPETPDELCELPGIGPYTANAVASFAFNSGNGVVDTNVKRILFRAFSVPDKTNAYQEAADVLLPEGHSRTWNNAIMELGGTVCQKQPTCDEDACPLRQWCQAYAAGDFQAPDVPRQSSFSGSRRQYRGRIIRELSGNDEYLLDELGPRIRADYTPEDDHEWLLGILEDLESDGLLSIDDSDDGLRLTLA